MLLICNQPEHQQMLQNKQFRKAVIKEAVVALHTQQLASKETSKTAVLWVYELQTAAMIYAIQPQEQKQMIELLVSLF